MQLAITAVVIYNRIYAKCTRKQDSYKLNIDDICMYGSVKYSHETLITKITIQLTHALFTKKFL